VPGGAYDRSSKFLPPSELGWSSLRCRAARNAPAASVPPPSFYRGQLPDFRAGALHDPMSYIAAERLRQHSALHTLQLPLPLSVFTQQPPPPLLPFFASASGEPRGSRRVSSSHTPPSAGQPKSRFAVPPPPFGQAPPQQQQASQPDPFYTASIGAYYGAQGPLAQPRQPPQPFAGLSQADFSQVRL